MPVSPDIGSRFAAPVADLLTGHELGLLETAALALRGDQDRDGWEAQALARIRLWRTRADRGVAGALAELGVAVRAALLGAQAEGAAAALVDLPGTPAAQPAGGLGLRGIQLSEERLGRQLAAALQQTPRLLEAHLREAVRAGVDEVRSGAQVRRRGSQQVLDKLVRQGVTGFRDSSGRNWSLSSYTEMAVRTETQARALAGGDASLRAAGLELVVVSDSPRECPLCRPFEGRVLSMDGGPQGPVTLPSETGGAPVRVKVLCSLAEARQRGFQHPNCTHSYSGFVPGATTLKKADANEAGYEQKQRQRAMERKIREWKRAEVLALDPAAQATAKAKVREWQAQLREHVKANDLKRQPGRESIARAV